ncbi:MAG: type 4a pilus biogenesis protein PilO [Candidatus Omnitrophica bacterium]|nr:type 4a pilus biogenesis protein PilO [Candidatus Omnitrophota bacterium]
MPDLSHFKFDIQQMDLNKVFEKLFEKKSLLAAVAVLVLVSVVAMALLKDYSSKAANYQNQMQQMHQKIDMIARHEESLKQLNQLTSSLPKPMSTQKLINQLTDYATQNQVDILDITPKETKRENLYTITVVHSSVNASSFKNLLLFLRAVETSPYALRVESWSGKSQESDLGTGAVSCEIDIASIEIKT